MESLKGAESATLLDDEFEGPNESAVLMNARGTPGTNWLTGHADHPARSDSGVANQPSVDGHFDHLGDHLIERHIAGIDDRRIVRWL